MLVNTRADVDDEGAAADREHGWRCGRLLGDQLDDAKRVCGAVVASPVEVEGPRVEGASVDAVGARPGSEVGTGGLSASQEFVRFLFVSDLTAGHDHLVDVERSRGRLYAAPHLR
jgi:hypothetical protein